MSRDGRARVTDFGLARNLSEVYERATGHRLSDLAEASGDQSAATPLTQPGMLMGTPRYMAPEQYCSEPLDERTDQFSFCVALFEALYGQPPFAGNTIATLCYNVISGTFAPPPPSAQVPAWLRAVLMRGLQQERERRYPDMDALLHALGRDPQRRLVRMAVTLLVVIGGAIVGAGSTHLFSRGPKLCLGAEQKLVGVWDPARRQAARSAVEAAAGVDSAELWSRIERGLDDYTAGWVAMHTEACLATHSRGEQSPQLLDLRMRCLSRRLQEVSAFTDLLQTANRRAAENAVAAISELPPLVTCADSEALSAPQPPPEDPAKRAEVERVYRRLSELTAQERVGRYAEVVKEAVAVSHEAEKTGYKPLAAEAWTVLAELENNSINGPATRDALFRAALAGIAGHNLRIAANAFTLLAGGAALEDQFASAIENEQLADAALGAAGEDPEIRARLINAMGLRAMQQKQLNEAEGQFRKSLALLEKQYGLEHLKLIQVLGNLALILERKNLFTDAMALRLRALRISEKQLGHFHPRLALALHGIGHVLSAQGALHEAEEYYLRALHIEERALGPAQPRVASTLRFLGLVSMDEGNYSQATQYLRRALAISRAQPQDGDVEVRTLQILALALRHQGLFEEAVALQEQAVALRTAAFGPLHPRVGNTLVALSQTRLLQKDYAGALRDAQRARAILLPVPTVSPAELADVHVAVGRALMRSDHSAAAQPELQEALRLREQLNEPRDLGPVLVVVAENLIALKRPSEALPLLERALALRSNKEAATDKLHGDAHFLQARALLALDRAANARPLCARAVVAATAARAGYLRAGPVARYDLQDLQTWSRQAGCPLP